MKFKCKNVKSFIIAIVIGLLLVGLDQLSKQLFQNALIEKGGEIPFINNFMYFRYVLNDGAGWGILSGKKAILVGMSSLMSLFLIYIMFILADFKNSKFLTIIICLLFGGTAGNLIDRAFYPSGVVDFIQFDFWPLKNFPTFNIADSFLSIGAVLLVVYLLFVYKEPVKITDEKQTEDENNA